MADNEKKIKTEGGNPQGNSQGAGKGGHGRSHRPHHGNRGKGARPKVDGENRKPEGENRKPKAENENRRPKGEGQRSQQRREGQPRAKGEGNKSQKLQQGQPSGERRKSQVQKAPRQGGETKKVVSPRAAMLIERQTAEQKAFAEAKDIMLEAAAARQKGEAVVEDDEPKVEIVGIRFKKTGKIYYFAPAGIQFEADEGVIVETARGQEYGFVALSNRQVKVSETVQPLKEVLRKATAEDTEHHNKNKELEKRAAQVFEELVAKNKLVMSLTDVEYTFDNAKLVFYFTADGRVDFRELVKDLAGVFRTRIELRQIGVRDEAKLMGGIGVCGMPFCCNRFLPDFVQVSIKMAKEQNLSLSSSKISGNCGRLMCCLRYEQDVYEQEHITFPGPDMVVRTAVGTGVVTESNFISGRIKVRLDGEGTAVYKVFTRDEVKVIGKAKKREQEPVDSELKALED